MPEVTYIINHPISEVLQAWLVAQANFLRIESNGSSTTVVYNHADEAAQNAFKELLSQQMGLAGENINTSDTDMFSYCFVARKKAGFIEDCFGDPNLSTTAFDITVSGTGAAITTFGAPGVGVFGVWQLSTGTTTTGRSTVMAGDNESFTGAQGPMTIEFLVKFPILSTAGEEYAFRMGLNDTSSTLGQDTVMFSYNRALYGNVWRITCTSNGVGTAVTSTTAVAADTWYRCKIVVNADATSASFYVNGVELNVSPITTNIPGTGRTATFTGHIIKSAGTTARTALLDYYAADIDLTTPR